MGLMDTLKGVADSLLKTADKALDQHGDKLVAGVDAAGDAVNKATKGKYAEHVDKGIGLAKKPINSRQTGEHSATVDPLGEPVDPIAEPVDPIVEPVDPIVEPVDPIAEPVDPITDPSDPLAPPAPVFDDGTTGRTTPGTPGGSMPGTAQPGTAP